MIVGVALATLPIAAWVAWRWIAPWSFTEPLGRLLGWFVGSVLKVRKRHVTDSMRRAHILAPERSARAMYRSLGQALMELLWIGARPKQPLGELVDLENDILDSALERGRGVVIATAHTGNWDLVACAAAELAPLTIVTKRLHVRVLDWYWQRIRRRRGIKLVDVGHAARGALDALKRKEVVAMLIDQAPERDRAVTQVRFLGRPAIVDLAPALIAMRARTPVVVAFAVRLPDGRHAIEVPGILDPPPRPSREWAEEAARTMTYWLEDFILREPAQWLWMHRRWKGAVEQTPISRDFAA